MRESFEKVREPVNPFRAAVLSVLMGVLPATAEAALPDCHGIRSNPVPTESVRLEDGDKAEVVCIVDGDTFDARLSDGQILRIRIWGVDCPESREQIEKCQKKGAERCKEEVQRGKKAKELTRNLLAGAKITLSGKFANIKHRKQAYVSVQGKDLGLALIRSCQCEEKYDHPSKDVYQEAAKVCR